MRRARRSGYRHKGQWEAAASIGMTPWQTLRRAILPQAAFRVALPPLSQIRFTSLGERYVARRDDSGAGVVPPCAANSFISTVKDKSFRRDGSSEDYSPSTIKYLQTLEGIYHMSSRVVNLGNSDRLISTTKHI